MPAVSLDFVLVTPAVLGLIMDPSIVRDPVYQQLNQRLRSLVRREYQSGQKFLTEREIVQRFAVSRATANKALASLVSEGLLEFRKGIGTFVRQPAISYDLRSLVSFTEKARVAGKSPSTSLLTFGQLKASEVDPRIAERLRVAGPDSVWELDRIRAIDGLPVILEHRYVVGNHCPKLTRLQAERSLYQAWTEVHHLQIAGADETVRAVLLKDEEAIHLKLPAGSPALEVVAVGFLQGEIPLWWERTLYRADQYEFHSRLGPVQSAHPLQGQFRPSERPIDAA
jgi:GntR family transcriptional regulator